MGARERNNYTDPTHRTHYFRNFSKISQYVKVLHYNRGELYSETIPFIENCRNAIHDQTAQASFFNQGCFINISPQVSRERFRPLSYSRHILIIALSAVLWCPPLIAQANSLPVVRITILYDGPHSDLGLGEIFRKQLIQKEVLSLTKGEFEVQFPSSVQFHGGWSIKKIRKALDALLKDPSVDMILTFGILSSNEAVQRSEFSKPVIAPFIIDPDLQNISSKKLRGQVPNFTYLVISESFERTLQTFQEIVPIKNLVLLQDEALLQAAPNLQKITDRKVNYNRWSISLLGPREISHRGWRQAWLCGNGRHGSQDHRRTHRENSD